MEDRQPVTRAAFYLGKHPTISYRIPGTWYCFRACQHTSREGTHVCILTSTLVGVPGVRTCMYYIPDIIPDM